MPIVDTLPSASGGGDPDGHAQHTATAPTGTRPASNTSMFSGGCFDAVTCENPTDTVLGLKRKKAEIRKERKDISRNLRNAERRTKRLKEKARLLSDNDLLSVVVMRRDRAAKEDGTSSAEGAHAADTVAAMLALVGDQGGDKKAAIAPGLQKNGSNPENRPHASSDSEGEKSDGHSDRGGSGPVA